MEKIWILRSKYSFKLYKTETDLLKSISKGSTQEVLEFELKSSSKAGDYLLSKERDLQLRSVLGELSEFEQNALQLITLYEELASDGKELHYSSTPTLGTTEKQSWISRLKKWQDNKIQFKNLLIDNRSYFMNVSNDLRWMIALLKCHNFMHCSQFQYDKQSKKSFDITSPELIDVFNRAKLELKKKKK